MEKDKKLSTTLSCYSLSPDSEVVNYIRHGETDYNKAAAFLEGENEMKANLVRWDEKYLDCRLNDEGIKQATALGVKLNNVKIHRVYCSPLRRCIETCLKALSTHPQKSNLEVIIHPQLTEIAHTIHDGSISLEEKISFFKKNSDIKIDWSLLKGENHTYNYKYLNQMPQMSNNDNNGHCMNLDVKFADLVKAAFEKSKRRLESVYSAFLRANDFKDYLINTELSSINGTKEISGKILVFSHSGYIRVSTLSKNFPFDEDLVDKYPIQVYAPKNCEIIGINPFV